MMTDYEVGVTSNSTHANTTLHCQCHRAAFLCTSDLNDFFFIFAQMGFQRR